MVLGGFRSFHVLVTTSSAAGIIGKSLIILRPFA